MELNGSTFLLRNWHLDDAASLQKHADNISVSSFLLDRFPSPYTLSNAIDFINLKINEEPVTNFAIVVNGEAAGVIGVDFRQDIYSKTPLLGYWVSEQHRGKGIMTEAIKLVTDYAFSNLNIICIQALVLSKNAASMRVLEKAGYMKQGILKQSVIKNNQVFDEHVYAAYKIESI
ncbi:MAG TPA: GNAT family protein [Mucilaginibacter sp.]